MKPWYTIDNPEALDTPALVIYPDRVAHNINVMKSFVDDIDRIRPHIKTNKCGEVIRMMMDAGIRKFKCATIAEAEAAADAGVQDLLLAYQPLGPRIARFCTLIKEFPGTTFACLVDNEATLVEIGDTAVAAGVDIRLYIDLNVGMNRTGIAPGADALALARRIAETPRLSLAGLHAYDGHLRDPDLAERSRKCDAAFAPVERMAAEIARTTGTRPAIIAGGTPTFPIHAKRKNVEVSPGTFIFWDHGYDGILQEQPFEFAALVVTRVISRPDDQTVCVDLGHKSIASENSLDKRVVFLNHRGLVPAGHSEEHLVLKTTGKDTLQVGDILYGVPYHICPTVALYDEAAVCRRHDLEDTWAIAARRKKITI